MTTQERRQARAELLAAAEALTDIADLVAEGRERYEASADCRAHLRYLWIVVGSRLKNHGAVLHIPRATGEFAQAIALRDKLAYTAPGRMTMSSCGPRASGMRPSSAARWSRRSRLSTPGRRRCGIEDVADRRPTRAIRSVTSSVV